MAAPFAACQHHFPIFSEERFDDSSMLASFLKSKRDLLGLKKIVRNGLGNSCQAQGGTFGPAGSVAGVASESASMWRLFKT